MPSSGIRQMEEAGPAAMGKQHGAMTNWETCPAVEDGAGARDQEPGRQSRA